MMTAAILNDVSKCIGCGACALACSEINGLPKDPGGSKLSAHAWTVVGSAGGVNYRRQCMHCLEPSCVSVCPVGALQKAAEGPITYDEKRCIGCRYCMLACPFDVPKYEWEKQLPKVAKCIMCYEKRISKGEQPACTAVCPTGATIFGDRDDLIEVAKSRIAQRPDLYVDHIYGLREAGGTSVLYISPVSFDRLGFKTGLKEEPYPKLTWDILTKIPNVLSVGGVALLGIYWIINRRMTIQRMKLDGELTEGEARRLSSKYGDES